jgi:hypothetical protein
MSKNILTIDKTLHEIFSESPEHGFRLSELRVEYSARSGERNLPVKKELFWQIFMQVEALKIRKLIRSEEAPSGGGVLFIEHSFWKYPFIVVDGLLTKRGLILRGDDAKS